MISHVKIVILTHIVEIRRLKVKYIVNLWIKDTSIQGTKCRVPLCPLKRGSTVIIYNYICIYVVGVYKLIVHVTCVHTRKFLHNYIDALNVTSVHPRAPPSCV